MACWNLSGIWADDGRALEVTKFPAEIDEMYYENEFYPIGVTEMRQRAGS